MGHQNKILLMSVDASYCNKTCFRANIANTHLIARCRRHIKLCFQAKEGRRRFYDKDKFTPDQILKDENIPWSISRRFYGGETRAMRYKEVNHVFWQNGSKRRPLRLIVLAPLPYVRSGKKNYREPAFLLTTDIEGDVNQLLQAYLDRLQIEYNHRDEKSILGVGQAQVRDEKSVAKQPALHVATYSALLLANLMTYHDKPHPDFPHVWWRPLPKRNTCRALIRRLRTELLENPEKIVKLDLTPSMLSAILSKVA